MNAAPRRTILDILRGTLFLIDHYAALSRPIASLSELRRSIRKTMAELEGPDDRGIAGHASAAPTPLLENSGQQP